MGELDYKKKLLSMNYKRWLENFLTGNAYYPQIIELDPTSNCMYSCDCCINSDLINRKGTIKRKILINLIDEFAALGGIGIIFIGGGEPLMYPDFGQILTYTYNKNIKIGITTNGFLLDKYIKEISMYSSWTRVSVDAATKNTYDIVRPCKYNDSFERVISNIEKLSKVKKGTLGFSFLLIEDNGYTNVQEISDAAILAKNLGCDYFELKPMVDSNHYLFKYSDVILDKLHDQILQLNDLKTGIFRVLFANSIDQYSKVELLQPKTYSYCPSAYLRNVITNYGIFPCPYKRGNQKFNMGTISNGLIKCIDSQQRNNVLKTLNPQIDCRFFCIRDEINEFLQSLKKGDIVLSNIIYETTEDVFV